MLTKQYNIIEVFTREPWKALTFKQIKELSGNKSDNYTHKTLKKLVNEVILKDEKVGNNILYSINDDAHALNTLGYVSEYKANISKHLPHKNIKKLIGKIKTSFYTFMIAGSYAKGRQKETSDLDVVIICGDEQKTNIILSQVRFESEMMIPEAHPYIFTESQFYEMLLSKSENYGKEAARNNLIITGGKQYYGMLMRAVENGFKG